jgi:TonB-linked SusC/RagA family outer membrane protein
MNKIFRLVSSSFVFFFLIGGSVSAQDKALIRGKVINKTDGKEALVGVSVVETDKDNRIISGTQTDLNGNYSIPVRNVAGQKLVFSSIGFKPATIYIGTRAVINVLLEEETSELEEVVIRAQRKIGVGSFNVDERDITSAYSRLDTKDIDALPVTSIDQALQGRMSGVDIVANSGNPGAGMSIRIRGTTSINGNADPLIVVNGIPYDTNISDDFDFATADEESYSQLLNISPSDIQEIVVLKDAASTAQYGSRGANGVLLIRTKRGTMGKPRLTYNMKSTVTTPRDAIPTLNGDQYATLILESAMNAGTPLDLTRYPEFAKDPSLPYYFYNYGQNTDWVKAVQKNAFKHEHNFSLSGGGDKALYRVSAGYLNEKGNLINTGYQRFTTTLSLNYNISDNLRVVTDISYTHGDRYAPFTSGILGTTYTKMPNQSIYEYTEDGVRTPVYFSPSETPQGNYNSGSIYNPVAMANESSSKTLEDRVRPVFTLQYRIVPSILEYQGTVAFDIVSNKSKGFLPQSATGRPWTENVVNRTQESDRESFVVQIQNTLTFSPKLTDQIKFQAVGKLNTTDKKSEAFSSTTSNTASVHLTDQSNPSRLISPNSGLSQERQLQATAITEWKFWDKYIINGILTTDGNSQFGPGYRYGLFPSASARWRVSGEPFVKDLKFLNDLSLRATYGFSGQTPGKNYLHFNQYKSYDYTYQDELGINPSSGMELKNLRWEKTEELNLGLNFIAFNNRLNMDFDWYRKTTNDLMFNGVGIPNISGINSITMNVGTLDNIGWELSVFTTPFRNKTWEIDFRFNLSRTQNMVRKLSENIPLSIIPTAENGKYMARIQEGNPLGSFYGYRYAGVYLNKDETIARDASGDKIYTYKRGEKVPVQMKFWYPSNGYVFEEGDAKYVDINHDGNIDYMDIVYLGNANPLLLGGFGPAVKYKRLTVEAYFYFRYGFDIVNQTKMDMEKMYDFNNQSTATLRRWREPYDNPAEAPGDLLPRALYKKGYNWLGSDRFVEDGSFIKFKSLTVRYGFNREWLKKISLSDMSLNFTVYNLYTWTKYTGMNPEVNIRNVASSAGIYQIGYDSSKSPSNMEFMLGLNVAF